MNTFKADATATSESLHFTRDARIRSLILEEDAMGVFESFSNSKEDLYPIMGLSSWRALVLLLAFTFSELSMYLGVVVDKIGQTC